MNEDKIRIKQYEQTADEKVSLNGIKWLRKWDVCVQCDSAEAAEALRARLAQPEPAQCDGGQCGIGGYCKQCPKTQPDVPETAFGEIKPVAWKMKGVPAFATSRPNDTDSIKWDALYTAPPKREWAGLTDDEIEGITARVLTTLTQDVWPIALSRAIEAKLREKNNG